MEGDVKTFYTFEGGGWKLLPSHENFNPPAIIVDNSIICLFIFCDRFMITCKVEFN